MTRTKTLLASFSLLALAAPAYANQEAFNKLDKDRDGMIGRQEYDAWSSAAGGASADQGITKASALIGKDVINRQGEDLGELKDVVIDLNGGKAHAAVLEFGGVLGMGEEHYALPVSQLQLAEDEDKLVLDIDEEKLRNAQGFAKGQWPAMNDEYWGRIGGQTAGAGATKAQNLNLVRASEMIGKNVQGKGGAEVGEIQDLTLGLKDGSVRNVIVDVNDGGTAMLQANALATGTDGKVMLNLNQDELEGRAK